MQSYSKSRQYKIKRKLFVFIVEMQRNLSKVTANRRQYKIKSETFCRLFSHKAYDFNFYNFPITQKDDKNINPAILILTQLSPFVKIELLLVVFLRRIFIIEVE